VHVFSNGITLKTVGNQTATATVTSSITGSASVTVNPAAADHLLFLQQPTNTAAGQTISPVVTVEIVDQFGNVLTNDNSDTVTVALGNNPGGGTLSGTLTITVSAGVATFSDLSIDQIGDGYTLFASANGLTAIESNPFSITM
jgi:S-adenosylmethionine hydrolase